MVPDKFAGTPSASCHALHPMNAAIERHDLIDPGDLGFASAAVATSAATVPSAEHSLLMVPTPPVCRGLSETMPDARARGFIPPNPGRAMRDLASWI
jgi:hypothetical protein